MKSRMFILVLVSSSLLAQVPANITIGFEDATAKAGIQFTHSFGARGPPMTPSALPIPTSGPRPRRLLAAFAVSTAAHALLALMVFFDVLGAGGGFGLGIGPGLGIGSGGGAGLGQKRRREIFSLEDLPAPVPPSDPNAEQALAELLRPARAQAIVVPQPAVPRPASPVVHFAPPARPVGSAASETGQAPDASRDGGHSPRHLAPNRAQCMMAPSQRGPNERPKRQRHPYGPGRL